MKIIHVIRATQPGFMDDPSTGEGASVITILGGQDFEAGLVFEASINTSEQATEDHARYEKDNSDETSIAVVGGWRHVMDQFSIHEGEMGQPDHYAISHADGSAYYLSPWTPEYPTPELVQVPLRASTSEPDFEEESPGFYGGGAVDWQSAFDDTAHDRDAVGRLRVIEDALIVERARQRARV